MDKIGLTHQFLPPSIRPLHPEMVIVGRAMPVLSGDVFSEKVEGSANPLSARGEKTVKRDLESGISATEAFARHGIM